MKDSSIKKALQKFNEGDYISALELYKSLSEILGEKIFFANVELCKKRINKKAVYSHEEISETEKKLEKSTIKLTNNIIWKRFKVKPNEKIILTANIDIFNGSSKMAISRVVFLDKEERKINNRLPSLPNSELLNANFIYLKDTSSKSEEILNIKVPASAFFLELGFSLFQANLKTTAYIKNLELIAENKLKLPSEFKVAMIADEFTYNSFKDEFIALPLEPESWKNTFEEDKPDIFFCESAWSGSDSLRRPWKGKIYASQNFSWENRKELLSIIEYCKQKKIPTIFWNKEDPTHYHDRVNDFVKTAKEFDYIFTTSKECIELYKLDYGLKNVYSLPFATNPRIFNPIAFSNRSKKVVFAGSWYATHSDRCSTMEKVFDILLLQGFELEIYDRYYGVNEPNRQWPERFKKYIKANVPHNEISKIYKSSKYGLNFNTVIDSETMFARRVFELMSCNTLVLSNYSVGLEKLFGPLVVFVDTAPERLKLLESESFEKIREDALELVLKEHTYQKRWEQILEDANIPFLKVPTAVTVIYFVSKFDDAVRGINWFQKNSSDIPSSNLLIVVDENVSEIEVASFYEKFNRNNISVTSLSHAIKYAMDGRYTPIKGKYFLSVNSNMDLPDKWLARAISHSQYIEKDFLTPAEKSSEKYTYQQKENPSFIFGKKEISSKFLSNIKNHKNFYVI